MNPEAMAVHQYAAGNYAKGTHPHADTWSFPPAPAEQPEHPNMDDAVCQPHYLTPEEGKFYDDNGFLHVTSHAVFRRNPHPWVCFHRLVACADQVPSALTPEHMAQLKDAADRVDDWCEDGPNIPT